MKKIISVMLALVVLLQCGCGGTKTSDTVSMYDLRQTMEAADKSLPEMLNASSADENAADQFAYLGSGLWQGGQFLLKLCEGRNGR